MEENHIKKRKTKEFLKYEFTREEKEDFAAELARGLGELELAELNKKEVVKRLDSEIAAHKSSISKYASYVKDGYRYQNVDCEITYDYDSRFKTIIRLDTGETVKTVPMTAEELQGDLFE